MLERGPDRRVLDRVIDQVYHHLLNLIVIRTHLKAPWYGGEQLNARLFRLWSESRNHLFQ